MSLASAFFWVTVMLVNSMAWKVVGFAFPPSARPVAAVVAVLLSEECLRPVVSRQCARLIGELERRATKLGHPSLTLIEKLTIFLGVGFGQGFAHACLLFLNTVVIAGGQGTYFAPQCPQMPYFLVTAINSACFFVVLSMAMVVTPIVTFTPQQGPAFARRRAPGARLRALIPAGFHAACTCVTLGNLVDGGCVPSSVCNGAFAIGASAITAHLLLKDGGVAAARALWKGGQPSGNPAVA